MEKEENGPAREAPCGVKEMGHISLMVKMRGSEERGGQRQFVKLFL